MSNIQEDVRILLSKYALVDVLVELANIAKEGDTDKVIAIGILLNGLTAQCLWD